MEISNDKEIAKKYDCPKRKKTTLQTHEYDMKFNGHIILVEEAKIELMIQIFNFSFNI